LPDDFSREFAAEILEKIIAPTAAGRQNARPSCVNHWKICLTKPISGSLAATKNGNDPLAEDWAWVRGHMDALLRLTQGFSARFAARKRDDGVLDFHDLEQFALKLLWDFTSAQPTAIARRWRQKIRLSSWTNTRTSTRRRTKSSRP